jgi:hypothetical protein
MRKTHGLAMMVTCASVLLLTQGEARANKWDDVAQFFMRKAVRGAVVGGRYLKDDGEPSDGKRSPPHSTEHVETQTQANGEGSVMLVLGGLLLATGGYLVATDPDVRDWLRGTRRR